MRARRVAPVDLSNGGLSNVSPVRNRAARSKRTWLMPKLFVKTCWIILGADHTGLYGQFWNAPYAHEIHTLRRWQMPGTHEMHVSCVFFEWYMGGMNQKRTDDMGLPSFSSSQNENNKRCITWHSHPPFILILLTLTCENFVYTPCINTHIWSSNPVLESNLQVISHATTTCLSIPAL